MRVRTKGRPQYVQVQISGLSRLMKTLGWPNGPPPPSHSTVLSWIQRTGCWWMSSIAAAGAGCGALASRSHNKSHLAHPPIISANFPCASVHLFVHLVLAYAYLQLDNRLLKSRPGHSQLPRLLAPRPSSRPVGLLHGPQFLCILNVLMQ